MTVPEPEPTSLHEDSFAVWMWECVITLYVQCNEREADREAWLRRLPSTLAKAVKLKSFYTFCWVIIISRQTHTLALQKYIAPFLLHSFHCPQLHWSVWITQCVLYCVTWQRRKGKSYVIISIHLVMQFSKCLHLPTQASCGIKEAKRSLERELSTNGMWQVIQIIKHGLPLKLLADVAFWAYVIKSITGYWTHSQTDHQPFRLPVVLVHSTAKHWSPPGLCAQSLPLPQLRCTKGQF